MKFKLDDINQEIDHVFKLFLDETNYLTINYLEQY